MRLLSAAFSRSRREVRVGGKESDCEEHVERRKKTIQRWTISKQAVHHQHCRELQYGQGTNLDCDFPSDESFSGSDDTTSLSLPLRYDISSKCCSICLEPFQVGERVSWASTNHCNHAFHPSCIQTWLICHEQCPLCRCRFMLCDDSRRKLPKAKLRALRKEYVKRQQSTYFCIEEGLQSYNNV